jgi:hypothetical protein
MTGIYDIVNTVKTHLRNHPIVNTVTFGDITEIDLNKTTMFPLAHFLLQDTTVFSNNIQITLSLLFVDITSKNNEFNEDDLGGRETSDNLVDVYNTQLQIANDLISELRRGDLYSDKYQLIGDPVCTPFEDRFENQLAGWSVDLTIAIPNNISVC